MEKYVNEKDNKKMIIKFMNKELEILSSFERMNNNQEYIFKLSNEEKEELKSYKKQVSDCEEEKKSFHILKQLSNNKLEKKITNLNEDINNRYNEMQNMHKIKYNKDIKERDEILNNVLEYLSDGERIAVYKAIAKYWEQCYSKIETIYKAIKIEKEKKESNTPILYKLISSKEKIMAMKSELEKVIRVFDQYELNLSIKKKEALSDSINFNVDDNMEKYIKNQYEEDFFKEIEKERE